MKLSIILFLSTLFFHSCGGVKKQESDLKRRNIDTYFNNNGVVKYFLPDIPSWANFSASGKCFRKSNTRYFDISAVRASFFISYEQALQQQLTFNQLIYKAKKPEHRKFITLEDEERFFFEASEKIQAGIRDFQKPNYQKLHIVWIDPISSNPKVISQLLSSNKMNSGHPVFLSMCMTRFEMMNYLRKNNLNSFNIRLISQELFSPFDNENNRIPNLAISLGSLFDKKQKFVIFIPRGNNVPQEILGKYKIQKF